MLTDPEQLRESIADALVATTRDRRCPPKALARLADADTRAVENWLRGANLPGLAPALRLMARDDGFFQRICDLIGRPTDQDLARDVARLRAELNRLRQLPIKGRTHETISTLEPAQIGGGGDGGGATQSALLRLARQCLDIADRLGPPDASA